MCLQMCHQRLYKILRKEEAKRQKELDEARKAKTGSVKAKQAQLTQNALAQQSTKLQQAATQNFKKQILTKR